MLLETTDKKNCNFCNSGGTMLYQGMSDFMNNTANKWSLYKCSNLKCQNIWLNPAPREAELYKAYSEYYTHEDARNLINKVLSGVISAYIKTRYGYKRSVFNWIKSLPIYLLPTERIESGFQVLYLKKDSMKKKLLDIGCGNGQFIRRMATLGWETEGVDVDKKAVDYCVSKGLTVHYGNLEDIKLKENCYDVITLNHVIEHLVSVEDMLHEIYRILKPGGKLIISTPNSNSWLFKRVFHEAWYCLDPPRHLNIFNLQNLAKIVQSTGFKIQKSKTTARNEFWIYTMSKIIRKNGFVDYSRTIQNKKVDLIVGKFIQLISAFMVTLNRNSGSEIHMVAEKP